MYRKNLFLMSVCIILWITALVPAATTWNGSIDNEWNNISNWTAGLPAAGNEAVIHNNTLPYVYQLIVHAGDICVPDRMTVRSGDMTQTGGTVTPQSVTGRLSVGWPGPSVVNISGGTLIGHYAIHLARDAAATGTINVSGTGMVKGMPNPGSGTHEPCHIAAQGSGSTATINISGGTFYSEIGMNAGYGTGNVATINVDGGMLNIAYGTVAGNEHDHSMTLAGGTSGTGDLYLTSGTVYVSGTLNVASGSGSTGFIDIEGGLLSAGECRLSTGGNGSNYLTINMTGGTFESRSSWCGIAHDGGVGVFTINNGLFDVSGPLWVGASYSGSQTGTDGTLNVSGNAQINCAELEIGLRGNGPGVNGIVNMDGGKITAGEGGVNIGMGTNGVGTLNMTSGTITTSGDLTLGQDWGAGAGTGTLYFDGGVIEANNVEVDSVIEFGTTSAQLILQGDDRAHVVSLIGQGKITQTVHPRASIEADYNAGTDKTTVYVAAPILTQAWNPDPGQGEIIDSLTVTLKWSPGDGATSHDVYFGDNEADVDAGTGGTSKGNQPAADLDYGPITLTTLAKTYYWRIDEQHPGGPTKGKIWSFTTPLNRCMETFEGYLTDADLKLVWGANGALETTISHSGQSMNVAFSGSAVSASRSISDSDWTNGGVESLSVWVRGDANVASVSVTLESNNGAQSGTLTNASATSENGGSVDVNTPDWHEMNFDLDDFGVVLTNVTKITVTVTPVSGGGNVYFDDICLYPKKQLGPIPRMDFNGDGIVNFGDLAIFAEAWLETNWFPGY